MSYVIIQWSRKVVIHAKIWLINDNDTEILQQLTKVLCKTEKTTSRLFDNLGYVYL